MMAIASFAMGVWATSLYNSPFTNAADLRAALDDCVAGDASGATCADGAQLDIKDWDISAVTTLRKMFNYSSFNADISSWDTLSVVDMSSAFYNAHAFNQDIGGWNTAGVTRMDRMFYDARELDVEGGAMDGV